jgi:hypothetical protein
MGFIALALCGSSEAVEYGYYEYRASQELNDIAGASDTSVWAVGNNGLILHYDGTGWFGEKSPTAENLLSVAAVDETKAYAVGERICLYRDGEQWRMISGLSGGLKVCALNSGEAWILDSRDTKCITYFDGASWATISIQTSCTITTMSVTDTGDIWLLARDLDGKKIYALRSANAQLTEFLILDCPDCIDPNKVPWLGDTRISPVDILAIDANTIWAAADTGKYEQVGHYDFDWVRYPTLKMFNNEQWIDATAPTAIDRLSAGSPSLVFAASEYGVCKIVNLTETLFERTFSPISAIYVSPTGQYWALEESSIRYYRDWPLSIQSIGCNIRASCNSYYYPYYVKMISIWACIQPTDRIVDAYILCRGLNRKIYSILPHNPRNESGRYARGIIPYARNISPIETEISDMIFQYSFSRSTDLDGEVAIILMPAGMPLNLSNSVSYYIYTLRE